MLARVRLAHPNNIQHAGRLKHQKCVLSLLWSLAVPDEGLAESVSGESALSSRGPPSKQAGTDGEQVSCLVPLGRTPALTVQGPALGTLLYPSCFHKGYIFKYSHTALGLQHVCGWGVCKHLVHNTKIFFK